MGSGGAAGGPLGRVTPSPSAAAPTPSAAREGSPSPSGQHWNNPEVSTTGAQPLARGSGGLGREDSSGPPRREPTDRKTWSLQQLLYFPHSLPQHGFGS